MSDDEISVRRVETNTLLVPFDIMRGISLARGFVYSASRGNMFTKTARPEESGHATECVCVCVCVCE